MITAFLLLGLVGLAQALEYVSCVGDSITWGGRTETSYPAVLQDILGDEFAVSNFGVPFATMFQKSDYPYWQTQQFQDFMAQDAPVGVVVIMLGTNDAKEGNWNLNGASAFESDYNLFISTVRAKFGSQVRILTVIPTPLYLASGDFNQKTINVLLPALVRRIANANGAQIIDAFSALGGRALAHADWFADGIHPTDHGYRRLAGVVARGVLFPKRKDAPLVDQKLTIACVGDSITEGVGASDSTHNFPNVLSTLLGDSFSVLNFGNSGKTMLKSVDDAYWRTSTYQSFVQSSPDIVFIMLGTNDGKNYIWNAISNASEEYFSDYSEFVKIVQNMESKPVIHLMIPPPLYIEDGSFNRTNLNAINALIPQIAARNYVNGDVIEIFDVLGGEELSFPQYFTDGCHPSNAGYYQIALELAKAVLKDKTEILEKKTTSSGAAQVSYGSFLWSNTPLYSSSGAEYLVLS